MTNSATPLREEAEPAAAKPVFTRIKMVHDLLEEGNQVQRVLKQWRRPDLARTITKFRIWTNANEGGRQRLQAENEQLRLDVETHRAEIDRLARALSLEKQRAAGLAELLDDAEHWLIAPPVSNSDRYIVGELFKRIAASKHERPVDK